MATAAARACLKSAMLLLTLIQLQFRAKEEVLVNMKNHGMLLHHCRQHRACCSRLVGRDGFQNTTINQRQQPVMHLWVLLPLPALPLLLVLLVLVHALPRKQWRRIHSTATRVALLTALPFVEKHWQC